MDIGLIFIVIIIIIILAFTVNPWLSLGIPIGILLTSCTNIFDRSNNEILELDTYLEHVIPKPEEPEIIKAPLKKYQGAVDIEDKKKACIDGPTGDDFIIRTAIRKNRESFYPKPQVPNMLKNAWNEELDRTEKNDWWHEKEK